MDGWMGIKGGDHFCLKSSTTVVNSCCEISWGYKSIKSIRKKVIGILPALRGVFTLFWFLAIEF